MQVVEGGGFKLFTDDPIVIALVRRCADIEADLVRIRNDETRRYRTLRHDVRQIKRAVCRSSSADTEGGE
jgi:hypothetical protein